jgi:hypothetical protein
VQGGVLSPNEARYQEDLDSVPYGDEPRVQQQVIPLSAVAEMPAAPPAPPAADTLAEVKQRDLDALSEGFKVKLASFNDAEERDKPVIRKTKANGLQKTQRELP